MSSKYLVTTPTFNETKRVHSQRDRNEIFRLENVNSYAHCVLVHVLDNCSRLHCVLYFHRRLELVYLLFDKCALTSILTFPDEILTNRRWRDVSE